MGAHLSRTVAEGRAFMQVISGKPVDSLSGERMDAVCPSDGLSFASFPASGKADVDRAVIAARQALETGAWAKMPAFERGRCLTRLGLAIENNTAELAALESRDTGKPVRQGRADVNAALRYFEFYGGAADKIHGDTIPFLDGYTALTLREPHGVVAGIIPWNYPLQILARVVGAALAMGNTLVIKPAEDASLTAIRIGELALAAGLRAQRRHRHRPRGGCRAGRPPGHQLCHLHRLATDRHCDPAGGGDQQSRRHHGAWREIAADRLRRRRHRQGGPRAGQRHHPE